MAKEVNADEIIEAVLRRTASGGVKDHCAYREQPAGLVRSHVELLSALAHNSYEEIVEIGTNTALGALALARGASMRQGLDRHVWSFDVCPEAVTQGEELAAEVGLSNVDFVLGTSALARYLIRPGDLGLAFVDGDHLFDGCLADLEALAPILSLYGHLIVHDFSTPFTNPGNGVPRAVSQFLLANPDFEAVYLGATYVSLGRYVGLTRRHFGGEA